MGVRKSVNFNVSLETYELVKEIFPDVIGTEDNLRQLVTAYKFWLEHQKDTPYADAGAEIEQLKQDLQNAKQEKERECGKLQAEIDRLEEERGNDACEFDKELNTKDSRIRELEGKLEGMADHKPTWDEIKQTISAFPAALLEATAKRLSEYYDREITPMQVMVDMHLRYTIERNAEWFYPFILKDKDIVEIARGINPEVIDIWQIKKSLNLN